MGQVHKNTSAIGTIGEQVAGQYLTQPGFTILAYNYWRRWGEIDIIAQKGTMIHFVEVKAVSHETKLELEYAVTHETWRPEELVHRFKLHQIGKAVSTWIEEQNYLGNWQIDVIALRIVPRETYATIKHIENVIDTA